MRRAGGSGGSNRSERRQAIPGHDRNPGVEHSALPRISAHSDREIGQSRWSQPTNASCGHVPAANTPSEDQHQGHTTAAQGNSLGTYCRVWPDPG